MSKSFYLTFFVSWFVNGESNTNILMAVIIIMSNINVICKLKNTTELEITDSLSMEFNLNVKEYKDKIQLHI